MNRTKYLLFIFVATVLLVGVPLAGAVQDNGASGLLVGANQAQDPVVNPDAWPDEPGAHPPLIGGKKADRPMVIIDEPAADNREAVTDATITFFYGDKQYFGTEGNPQQWVNILGNVAVPAGTKVNLLTYRIESGNEREVSVGKDNRRLVKDGDFNIEIDRKDLSQGNNKVTVTATDSLGGVTEAVVTVNYDGNNIWPESYDTDWSNLDPTTGLQGQVQIVDGYWEVQGGDLKIIEVGYDRLAAMGEEADPAKTWKDYEMTVPITVTGLNDPGFDGVSNGPAVGVFLRWQGHTAKNDATPEQPLLDFDRIGAIGWYRWFERNGEEGLELRTYDKRIGVSTDEVWQFGVPYMLKMSVQSAPNPADKRAWYRLKIWRKSDPEPTEWAIEGYSKDDTAQSGSAVLVAHHVYAEFGDVKIRPLSEINPVLTVDTNNANGTVDVKPPPFEGKYTYGTKVNITATANPGYYIKDWTGDLSAPGIVNPFSFNITEDTSITANFAEAVPGTLTVNVVPGGAGTVTKTPDLNPYSGGEVVTLNAVPNSGYGFVGWSGDLTGTLNPDKIQMVGNRNVTATFAKLSEGSPVSDNFNGCAVNTNIWSEINPSGNGSISLNDGKLVLGMPGGAAHTMWKDNLDAPRIMQATDDQNFSVDIKFDTIPSKYIQTQGFLAEQDSDNWLRFDIFYDGNVKLFAGGMEGGIPLSVYSKKIEPGASSVIYLRVIRTDDLWKALYSTDGQTWMQPGGTFSHALNVTSTGVFAGNQPEGSAPAFETEVDYFMNTAFPVDPGDGTGGSTLTTEVVGNGEIQQNPEPDENNMYACGQVVTLTAVPDSQNNYIFGGWSGDLSGSQNPQTITMDGNRNVTATFTFVEGPGEWSTYLPSVHNNS